MGVLEWPLYRDICIMAWSEGYGYREPMEAALMLQ